MITYNSCYPVYIQFTLFIAKQKSIVRMCHKLFIHSPIYGLLGIFLFILELLQAKPHECLSTSLCIHIYCISLGLILWMKTFQDSILFYGFVFNHYLCKYCFYSILFSSSGKFIAQKIDLLLPLFNVTNFFDSVSFWLFDLFIFTYILVY